MLMAYNLYREDVASVYDPAIAIEVYHNHTLLHDDLMDRSDMRRGSPPYTRFGTITLPCFREMLC